MGWPGGLPPLGVTVRMEFTYFLEDSFLGEEPGHVTQVLNPRKH